MVEFTGNFITLLKFGGRNYENLVYPKKKINGKIYK
jgi:hypothetical protein